jgi:hypothetical protein
MGLPRTPELEAALNRASDETTTEPVLIRIMP